MGATQWKTDSRLILADRGRHGKRHFTHVPTPIGKVIQQLRSAWLLPEGSDRTDGQLLETRWQWTTASPSFDVIELGGRSSYHGHFL